MFQHLLVPLDGSELAEQALPPASALAKQFNAEITLLRVIQPPYVATHISGSAYGEVIGSLRRIAYEEGLTYLKEWQSKLRQEGYRVHIHMVEGDDVAGIILNLIGTLETDTVVMSTHGRGGISRWVYGSVADKVLRAATAPILLIRASD
jgi:nucleotide-binding universal stress UspA family protein